MSPNSKLRRPARGVATAALLCGAPWFAGLTPALRAQETPATQPPSAQDQTPPTAQDSSTPSSQDPSKASSQDQSPPSSQEPSPRDQTRPGQSSAELPATPAPGLCTLHGRVHGSDGGTVPGASLTLLGEGKVRERTAKADSNGEFLMEGVPCGEFVLSVAMPGFAPAAVAGTMAPAGEVEQQDVTLRLAGANESVNVVATQAEIAQAQVELQEHQRMLGAFPNFFVSYQWSAVPLRPRQKFGLAWHTAADPANIVLAGVIAGVQQANNSLPGYGEGAVGYGSRFGANLGNQVTGTFLGGAILPTIFHQDPRYFYRGTGSNGSRLWYAVSRAFVTRGDNGREQVNFSGLLGDLGSGAISNLYAVGKDRQGAGLTVENGLLGIVGDCVNYTLQEFLLRKVTSRTRGRHGQATDGTATP